MKNQSVLWGRLGLLLCLTAGCATTSTKTTAKRAPWLSLKGAKTVRVDITGTCVDKRIGPDRVEVVTSRKGSSLGPVKFGGSTSTMKPRVRTAACNDARHRQTMNSIRAKATALLKKQGYTVSAQGERTLTGRLSFVRLRSLKHLRESKDTKADTSCQKMCRSTVCQVYEWDMDLQVKSTWTAPGLDGVDPQTLKRDVSFSALPTGADNIVLACGHEDARRRWTSDKSARWSKATSSMLRGRWSKHTQHWMGLGLMPMLTVHRQPYELHLFDVDDLDSVVSEGKAGRWSAAAKRMTALANSALQQGDLDAEDRARYLYNLGAVQMMAGDLEGALDRVEQSVVVQPSEEGERLLRELRRRLADVQRM